MFYLLLEINLTANIIVIMKSTVAIITKGSITMPAKVRKSMGVNKRGDKLLYTYDEKEKVMTIKKPTVDFSTPVVMDTDSYYKENRSKK